MSSLATARTARIPRLSRFGWLMGLYAENHARLHALFDPAALARGVYLSSVGDGLDVRAGGDRAASLHHRAAPDLRDARPA